jgi:hypothetical protein
MESVVEEEAPWRFPKNEIVFFCQVVLVFTVVIASLYHLSQDRKDRELWTSLLSSSIGYLLPNPKIKKKT